MAAQAVSGYAHFFSVADNFGFFKGLNPFFHIGNLPECPAFVGNFHVIGCLVVAGGIVDEFGAAEGDDQIAFFNARFRVCPSFLIGFAGAEQRAGKACAGVGNVGDDFPFLGELFGLGFRESAGALVTGC